MDIFQIYIFNYCNSMTSLYQIWCFFLTSLGLSKGHIKYFLGNKGNTKSVGQEFHVIAYFTYISNGQ